MEQKQVELLNEEVQRIRRQAQEDYFAELKEEFLNIKRFGE
jgi:hypothetical protein